MRDKVLEAIARYAEGGSIGKHLDDLGLKRGDFYAYKRKNPDAHNLYLEVQEARADMMVDEAYLLGTDKELNPQVARVQAEIRMKIAAAFDRRRFGDRVQLDTEVKVSLMDAIEAGRQRALRPPRDLGDAVDATYIADTNTYELQPSDSQSDEQRIALLTDNTDPFEP